MSYSLSFVENDGFFVVEGHGEIDSFETFSEKGKTVVGKVLSTNSKRVLLDDRDLRVSLDSLDISRMADLLEKANLQALGLRLASLCHPESRKTYSNIETIYQNRSINFRLFDDEKAAIKWLLS